MEQTSSSTRALKIVEIFSVSDDEAKAYLYYQGMPKSLADNIVKHVGGRLIHLQQTLATYEVNPDLNEKWKFITSHINTVARSLDSLPPRVSSCVNSIVLFGNSFQKRPISLMLHNVLYHLPAIPLIK